MGRRMIRQWGVGFVAAVMAFFGLVSAPVMATSGAQSISQGFQASGELTVGSLVSYAETDSTLAVTAASTSTVDRLVGVVGQNALIELSDGTKQTQVVTSGSVLALVSDINGDINTGDKITVSPITGVGMKSVERGMVVGTASEPFSDAKEVHTVNVTDRSGTKQTVKVGLVSVQVAVAYSEPKEDEKSILPTFVLQLAQAISGGRSVSVVRVVIALVVLLVGILVIGVLVYASVRSSIVSIGRNPLAARSINKSLLEVSAMAVGILLIMLIAVYLILVI